MSSSGQRRWWWKAGRWFRSRTSVAGRPQETLKHGTGGGVVVSGAVLEWLVAQARAGGSCFQAAVVVVVGMGSCLSCRVSCRPEWYNLMIGRTIVTVDFNRNPDNQFIRLQNNCSPTTAFRLLSLFHVPLVPVASQPFPDSTAAR